MKKKLEAELISIAHRILKLKNKSEIIQLHQETQKLYEKLSVLLFVEENFGDVKPTIGQAEIVQKIETIFESKQEEEIKDEVQPEIEVVPETVVEEVIAEAIQPEIVIEEEIIATNLETSEEDLEEKVEIIAEEETNFKPAFELSFDSNTEEKNDEVKEEIKNETSQITFDDLLGANYSDPVFVKPEEIEKESKIKENQEVLSTVDDANTSQIISINKNNNSKIISLNDTLSKGIIIGLNDRIAFIKHLFADSSEDFNRVLSQIITFDTYQEVQTFIDDMVKPDYNNWDGKDEYSTRFMEIVEKKFA
jgi:hypothetical protein